MKNICDVCKGEVCLQDCDKAHTFGGSQYACHGHKPLVEEKPSPEQTERWEEDYKTMAFQACTMEQQITFIRSLLTKAEARGRVAGMTEIGRKCLGAIHHAKYGEKIGCVCCDAILTVLQDNGVEIKSDGV